MCIIVCPRGLAGILIGFVEKSRGRDSTTKSVLDFGLDSRALGRGLGLRGYSVFIQSRLDNIGSTCK
jgi:hypothetical protein